MDGDTIEFRVKALEEDRERNSAQHREFYRAFKELEKSGAVTQERYNTILSTMSEMRASIEALKAKPGKRWESVVDKALWAVAGAVVAWLLAGAPGM